VTESWKAGKLESWKAGNHSEPWYLVPPPPQNIAVPLSIPARNKPRLEEPPPATTDEAARKNASPAVPPPDAESDDANADPVTDTNDVLDCCIDRAIGRKNRWTKDEDLKLKNSVQMHGGKDWAAIAAMAPGRTKSSVVLNPSIALTAGHAGKWTADEDLKLKGTVRTHGGKNWVAIAHGGKNWMAIAALAPGRAEK
jgi:hypothetical protein